MLLGVSSETLLPTRSATRVLMSETKRSKTFRVVKPEVKSTRDSLTVTAPVVWDVLNLKNLVESK